MFWAFFIIIRILNPIVLKNFNVLAISTRNAPTRAIVSTIANTLKNETVVVSVSVVVVYSLSLVDSINLI